MSRDGVLPGRMQLVTNETGQPELVLPLERSFVVILAASQDEAKAFAAGRGLRASHVIAPGWPSSLDGARVGEVFVLESYYRRPGGWRKSIEEQLAVAVARQGFEPVRHNVSGS